MKAGELYFDIPAVFLLLLSSFSSIPSRNKMSTFAC